jgi:hypothetical protein
VIVFCSWKDRTSWWAGLACLGIAAVLLTPIPALAQLTVLERDVKQRLKKHGVLPESIPSGEFTARDLLGDSDEKGIDPLVLVAHWEKVRVPLQQLYKERLDLKKEPDLRLGFLWVNRDKPKEPKRLRVVFPDPGNFKVQRSLVAVLGLPGRSFEGFSLVRGEKAASAETVVVQPPKKIKDIDWKATRAALEKVFRSGDLAKLKLKIATGETSPPRGLLVCTHWEHLGDVEKPRESFYWRVEIRLSPGAAAREGSPGERWILQTAVPIARKKQGGGYQKVVPGTNSNLLESQAVALLRPVSTRSVRIEVPRQASIVYREMSRGVQAYHTKSTDGTCVEPRFASGLRAVAERVFALATKAVLEAPGFEGSVTTATREKEKPRS